MKSLLQALIRAYRYAVSPFLAPRCIYYPSCSAYAEEALNLHGWRRGLLLAARRILRCHPLARGGYDPVPAPDEHRRNPQETFEVTKFKEQS